MRIRRYQDKAMRGFYPCEVEINYLEMRIKDAG
jgi:hypothetical protein